MIDLKALRSDPDRFRRGANDKGITVDIDRLLELDEQRRAAMVQQEACRAEQKRIGKELGPSLGKLKGQLKSASDQERPALDAQISELEARPLALKEEIQAFDQQLLTIEPQWRDLLLQIPQPPDDDVPKGASADENIELRCWNPSWFDPSKPFESNQHPDGRQRTNKPRTHLELIRALHLADIERGVKMSGTRQYLLTGDGARLHQAVLRLAFDLIVSEHGFRAMTIPVIVREESMVGTGFFPSGRDQAYHIEESRRGAGHDLFLTGTGEVALMSIHQDEILDPADLPLKYATVSTCFRREAGAAGKDTAGLYRVHQFDKVEQVVITRADEAESRQWHQTMIGIVEQLMQILELPYRLLQCCTGDLGPKNADMIDVECWMPGRGEDDADGRPLGAYGETHSASRLYDFQCRRLNLRYRDGKNTMFCHSLNNTVIASPRILVPILEMYQDDDGGVTIPEALQPYMGQDKLVADR
jgi:seryl-tRNA synthetase